MKSELNEKELTRVSGGSGEEHQVSINLWLPQTGGQLIIKVYVDGVNDRSKTSVVDTSTVSSKQFTFSGSGTSQIRFTLSNGTIYTYSADFDNCLATRIS